MFKIGDIVQLDFDIPTLQLKAGTLGTIVHIHEPEVYEIEPVDESLDLTYRVDISQVTLAWSIRKEQWLPLKERAMRTAWHNRKVMGEQKPFGQYLKEAWSHVKNTKLAFP
jgi:hypothetical protein